MAGQIINFEPMLQNIENNKNNWKSLFEEYEEKMKKEKENLNNNSLRPWTSTLANTLILLIINFSFLF